VTVVNSIAGHTRPTGIKPWNRGHAVEALVFARASMPEKGMRPLNYLINVYSLDTPCGGCSYSVRAAYRACVRLFGSLAVPPKEDDSGPGQSWRVRE
jgi:hypothetical protein